MYLEAVKRHGVCGAMLLYFGDLRDTAAPGRGYVKIRKSVGKGRLVQFFRAARF